MIKNQNAGLNWRNLFNVSRETVFLKATVSRETHLRKNV